MRLTGYIWISGVCLFYWILDSIWSYLSFEYNLKKLIFSQPSSYLDTFLLKVPPYQIVSRLMVVILFAVLGSIILEFMIKRHADEKNRKEAHDTLLTVLNSIDATIYAADMNNHEILFMNKFMIDSFGGNFSGKICHQVFRNNPEPCDHCTNSQLLDEAGRSKGLVVWEGKNPITNAWYLNYDRAIKWVDGRMVRLQIAMNITKIKELERERSRTKEQLRQVQKMESVGRLAGGVAHDFNNMLSIILGNTEMILEEMEEFHPFAPNLQEIHKAADRSANLTRKLLAFARKQTVSPKILDINTTLASMHKILQRLIGEDIDLVWRPEKDLWPVKVDSSQIDQVLTNLCVNARDAVKGGGRVAIETGNVVIDEEYCHNHSGFVPGQFVMICVSDTGYGMDAETRNNLFEPFFTTKNFGEGTGLGLSTVYGIVKQNNGFINVYSEPGHGTTFKVYLPRYAGDTTDKIQKKDAPTEKGHETILLVEDEKAILKMAQMMLNRLGYAVLAASGPTEAIKISESYSGAIHMLMTDVVMPDMSGRELADKLTSRYPDIKCLFMSGYTADIIAHKGVLDKGIQFIHKPFTKKDLADKVRKVLKERAA